MVLGSIIRAAGSAGKAIYRSGVLPEMARGAIVAASNPARGEVGTAGDIFSAIGAVDEDRQRRMALQREREQQLLAIQRQAEEDERKARLAEAQEEELRTRAEYNQRRGQPSQGRTAPPTKVDLIRQQVNLAEEMLRRPLSERETQTLIGTHGPQYDMRSDEAYWANAIANAASDEERRGIQAAREAATKSLASAKSSGAAEGKAPFMRPFAFQTEGGAKLVRPSFLGGKMAGVEEQNIAFTPRKPAPRQGTASDERLSREKTISAIVNRVLKEDASNSPANALRNVQQFYQGDPEVQQYKAEVMARLQGLIRGSGSASQAEKTKDANDRAKDLRARKKLQGAAVEVWTRDASGNLVRAK